MFPDSTTLTHPWWIGAWCAFSVIILYSALRRDKADKLLRRIKILRNEIDLFEINKDQSERSGSELHDPIFNKFMDDVLYLLNNSGADVYVFEDIDRFSDSIEIFEKLRELNMLANGCRRHKSKPLRFFYLVREDLFETPEDRVKFFDFIIPVIPFADPDGNFDELRSGLRSLGLNVGDLFVYEISAFIPDPRALKEIVNEVKHYQEHIFHDNNEPLTEDEAEHLVAAIVYKVIFPTDFSNFQRGKGYVAEILKRREDLISIQRDSLEEEKKAIETEISEINEKNRFTLDELVLTAYFDRSYFSRYGIPISNAKTTKEIIDAIRNNDQASKKLDEVIEEFLSDETNLQRFGEPKEYLDKRKSDGLARIRNIDDELQNLSCRTLGQLLVECLDDSQFIVEEGSLKRKDDFEDCKMGAIQSSEHFPLLKHLLRTGLIDSSSLRYIIRVRPEGLSLSDQRNLAAILGRRPIDSGYVFEKPSDVLMRIRNVYLMVPGTQNFSILREILDKKETSKLSSFVAGLLRHEHASFLIGYVISDQFLPDIFSVMENNFDKEAEIILSDESTSVEKRRNFAHKLIRHEDSWTQSETEDALVKFANNDPGFLIVDETLLEGVRGNIDRLPLALSDIDFANADAELLGIVYEKSLYEPNAVLVEKWVENRFPYHVVDRNSIVSIVYSLSDGQLHQFVESKMDLFISSVLETTVGSLTESENVLVWVLNALSDDKELMVAFVSRLEGCVIRDLNQIEDTSQKRTLLLYDIPTFSTDNVLAYYYARDNTIDDALASYIHNHIGSEESNQTVIAALSGNEEFLRAAIENTDMTNADLRILLSGGGSATLDEFDIENLDQARVEIIVRADRVPASSSNVQFIREHYSDCEAALADSDIDAYLALFNEDDESVEFVESVGLELFESNQIIPSKKVEIARLFASPIQLVASYPDLLKIEIINNHFDTDDLPQLLDEFESGGKQLQESIKSKAAARFNEISSQKLAIPCGLFCELLKEPSFSDDTRLEQIALQLSLDDSLIADRECVRRCFEAAGAQDYVRLMGGKKISVPANSVNSNIVNALVKRGMCSDKIEQGANGFVIVSPKGYGRK